MTTATPATGEGVVLGPGPSTPPVLAGFNQQRRWVLVKGLLLLAATVLAAYLAVVLGAFDLTQGAVLGALLGREEGRAALVVWGIRLPRIAASLVMGWSLGLAGLGTMSLLKNPLASPFTLGISQGAAFGAALAIVAFGAGNLGAPALAGQSGGYWSLANAYLLTGCAMFGSLAVTAVIVLLARVRKMSPQAVILAGVALSSLSLSGTILVQYLASEVEVAAVVFWTFGDVARSTWREIGLLAAAALPITVYFLRHRWDLNAMNAGEDLALGLGVEVERLRLTGMLLCGLLVALGTAFHGVVAFLGLLAPHIARRLVGADHGLLIPFSCLLGGLLLLLADTAGRLLVGSGSLPVGVLTSFLGAPLFLYLLLKGGPR